ncbi:type II and III secretion system protein family protein [Massilia sp. Se16.2.3]|uniref:type II and III secretion system protein family protein n=1 Tax=Massilia sp. Se16.2.3 TaxID=2709303 RepID=UPI0016005127|nr:pilus assembly protein N-terminal domain-containing protein [Massilia sp. Se16.2.3]QNA99620.1 type II and III secretion system protein [Massilia sp. Se16.2.3]
MRTVSTAMPRQDAKRKAPRDAVYAPIQKPDDDGQIPEIQMFVGESRVFPAPNVARIVVGNGQIMSATALDGKEVIIFGNAAGTTTLFVWNEDGRYQRVKVNIMQGDISRVAREVAAFMAAIPNAKVSIVGDKVIVEGDALSDEDRDKVGELAKRYPQIVNFTSAVGWEKMVMMDVKVVEFPKSELRELGLKWTANGGAAIGGVWGPIRRGTDGPYQIGIPTGDNGLPITDIPPNGAANPNGGGGVTIPQSLNVLGALNMGLSAKLNLLAQNGTASVLAEPQLSARSGVKASFLAGGEFPYAVTTIQGPSVMFKQYGIKLDVEPRIGRDGIIRAVIDSEVSSIDQSVTTAAGPALLTRRTKTEFNARSGETIVLSGLLQRNISSDIDKVPGLGNIPILGALFRSKRYQNKETELVVFVTPTIVDAHSPGLVDRVNKTTERLSDRLDKSPYLSDPLQPGKDAQKFNQGPGAGATVPRSDSNMPPAPARAPVAGEPPVAMRATGADTPGATALLVLRDGLVLRAEPSDASAALLELGYHAVVDAGTLEAPAGLSGKWRHVAVGQVRGWVRADSVAAADQQAAPRAADSGAVARKAAGGTMLAQVAKPAVEDRAAADRQYRVVLDGLAVHVSPDINSVVVAKLGGNQLVNGAAAAKGSWMPIESGAVRGWVSAQWLQNVAMAN